MQVQVRSTDQQARHGEVEALHRQRLGAVDEEVPAVGEVVGRKVVVARRI